MLDGICKSAVSTATILLTNRTTNIMKFSTFDRVNSYCFFLPLRGMAVAIRWITLFIPSSESTSNRQQHNATAPNSPSSAMTIELESIITVLNELNEGKKRDCIRIEEGHCLILKHKAGKLQVEVVEEKHLGILNSATPIVTSMRLCLPTNKNNKVCGEELKESGKEIDKQAAYHLDNLSGSNSSSGTEHEVHLDENFSDEEVVPEFSQNQYYSLDLYDGKKEKNMRETSEFPNENIRSSP